MDVLVIIGIVIIGFIGFIYFAFWNTDRKIKNLQVEKNSTICTYSEIKNKIKIPENSLIVCRIIDSRLQNGQSYCWLKDKNIYFFPTLKSIELHYRQRINAIAIPSITQVEIMKSELKSISIQDIVSFERRGEIAYENKISGGGGGGSSIGKAVVGGLVAGGTGAIVASRNKIKEITSEFITHDNRECILTYRKDNAKFEDKFQYEDYEVFNELIPEKEINVVDEIRRRNLIEQPKNENTHIIQKIRDLGALKDEGILTLEEFEEKKRELLKKV